MKDVIKRLVNDYLDGHPDKEVMEADMEAFDANPLPLVEQIAEDMQIVAGNLSHDFLPEARFFLAEFEAAHGGRAPRDCVEAEEWSLTQRRPPRLI